MIYGATVAVHEKDDATTAVRQQTLSRARSTARNIDVRLALLDEVLDSALVRARVPRDSTALQDAGSGTTASLALLAKSVSIAVIDSTGARSAMILGAPSRIDMIPAMRRASLAAMANASVRKSRNTGPATVLDEGTARSPSDSIALIVIRPIPQRDSLCNCLADTKGAVIAAISDRALQQLLGGDSLPDDGVAVLIGGTGNQIGRARSPERWIDAQSVDSYVLTAAGDREGVLELKGADDVSRIFGYALTSRMPWHTYVGVPLPQSADAAGTVRMLALLALLALMIGAVGLSIAGRSVRDAIQTLMADIRRLAAGVLSHRTEVAESKDELGQLGRAVNELADELEVRRRAMQDELQRNTQVFVESPVAMWMADASENGARHGRIRQANRAAGQLLGVAPGALVGQRDSELLDEAGATLIAPIASDVDITTVATRAGHAIVRTATGETLHCLLTVAFVEQSQHPVRIVTVQPVAVGASAAPVPVASAPPTAAQVPPAAVVAFPDDALSVDAVPVDAVPVSAVSATVAPETVQMLAVAPTPPASAEAFADHVADDFGDLLASLSGFADLALECANDPHMRTIALERLRELSARGLSLTQQVRTYARREPPQMRVLDANEMMNAALAATSAMRSADVDLDLRCNVSPAVVLGDAALLQQVVTALITNAHAAMPAGGTLTAATTFVEMPQEAGRTFIVPAGQYIVLTIADTGVGMSAATQARMFEPFFTTGTRSTHGAGMGLATVAAIAAQHGWVIGVESEMEVGTAISLYMPLAEETVSLVTELDDQSSRVTEPSRSA